MSYGMLGHFGISKQNSFGTATNSFDYMPIISESLTTGIEELIEEGMRSRLDESPSHAGLISVTGDVVFEPHPIMIGHFLKGALGQASSTLANSVYTWEFLPATSDFDANHALQPYTLEVYRDTTNAFQFTDAIITGLTLETNAGAIIRSTATIMAKVSSLTTKTTPTYETGAPWTWNQASLSIANSATNTFQEAMTFSIDNQIEGVIVMNGTRTHGKYKRTAQRVYNLTGTACFENEVEWELYRLQGDDSGNQRFISTMTGATTAQSYTNEFIIDTPSVRYKAYPVNMGGPGRIAAAWEGNPKFDTTSSYVTRITLVNTRASY